MPDPTYAVIQTGTGAVGAPYSFEEVLQPVRVAITAEIKIGKRNGSVQHNGETYRWVI